MDKILFGLAFSLMGATAIAGPEFDPPGMPPNLAVEIAAPGAVRAEIQISIPSLKEVQRYDLSAQENVITGGVHVSPENPSQVSVVAFDASGNAVYKGEGWVEAADKLTNELRVPLDGGDARSPPEARFGTYLLTAGVIADASDTLTLELTVLDPFGNHVPFGPDELDGQLPEGFPELPYSCFNNSLCILEWKPTREQETIYLCWKSKHPFTSCITTPPPDRRGPYRFVSVGENHTCAITITNDLRCWGDNQFGQLGAYTANCPANNNQQPCSLVPVPVQCSPGESCKYRWVSAARNHTCAIDSNGNAWCWGEEGSPATGVVEEFLGPASPEHRPVRAANNLGQRADFVSIDTNITHTCALSAAGDVYCWGENPFGELGFPSTHISGFPKATSRATLVQSGNKYKSITTGHRHSCAVQTNGLLDCWGMNSGRQIHNAANVPNSDVFATVNSKVPLLNNHGVALAAGGFNHSCAAFPHNDLICWGAPDGRGMSVTSGFVAMPAAFAISLSTENDNCSGTSPFLDCANTCVVDQWGWLSCGRWSAQGRSQLSRVPEPKTDHLVYYSQVDVGQNHTCMVTTHRDVWCFGLNTFGQFGTGSFTAARTWEPKVPSNR